MKSFFIALVVGLPKIEFIDLPIIVLIIFVFLINIRNLILGKLLIITNNRVNIFLFLVCILILLSLLSLIYNMSFSITYTLRPLRILVFSLLFLFIIKKISFEDILKGIIIAGLVNSIVIYIQYTYDFLGINPLVFHPPGFSETVITPYRKPGIFNGYPTSGLINLLTIISLAYFFVKSRKILLILISFFILPTLIITSRTALLEFFIFFTFILVLSKRSSYKKALRLYANYILLFIVIILLSGYYLYNNNSYIQGSINKAFIVFINNYERYGVPLDYSSEDLIKNHYQFPEDIETFLIGNSKQPFDGGVCSDVSFVRILFTTGIFSLLIYIYLFAFIFFNIYKYLKNKILKYFTLLILSIIFISCFKGPYLFSRTLGDIILMIGMKALTEKRRL